MTEANAHEIFIAFGKVTTVVILIPILVALWQRKHLNRPLKIFWIYRIIYFVINILEQAFYHFAVKYYEYIKAYLIYWGVSDTSFLSILYYINTFICLSWFYYLLLPRPLSIWIFRIGMTLIVASVINYMFLEGYQAFGFYNPTASAIFAFSVAGLYLWHAYKNDLALPITKNPYFWLSIGLMLPYVISFFLYLVQNVMLEDNYTLFVTLSILKNCFVIIGQLFIAFGFWRAQYARFVPLPYFTKKD